jgi:hypothetical protein
VTAPGDGSGRNAGLLAASRAPRAPRIGAPIGRRTERGAQPVARDYEQGPWPHQVVAPFPAEAVALWERRTGRKFDAEAVAEWERVRGFLAYEGIALTPALEAAQRIVGGGAAVASDLPERARHLAARAPIQAPARGRGSAMPDPDDLGDD